MRNLTLLSLSVLSILCISSSYAESFGGIEFPDGIASFADAVILYDPMYSGGPSPSDNLDPATALGPPQGYSADDFVALGRGGMLELAFTNNYLVNSGDESEELHIFEVGPDVEDTFVAIRPTTETALLLGASYDADGDGFYEIGKIFGSTSSIDIDVYFVGFEKGLLKFDAVQLIDDYNEGQSSGHTVGSDIDAVGAIMGERICSFYLAGDADLDCDVDLEDFVIMASNWLINCNVDPDDLACIPI